MLKKILIYIYYALLIVVFMSWTDPAAIPNRILMYAFLLALVVPIYLKKSDAMPVVLSLFIIMAKTGVSNSYSPTDITYYLVLVITGLFLFRPDNIKLQSTPRYLIALLLLMIVANFVTGSGHSTDTIIDRYYMPFVFLIFFYSYKNMAERSVHLFSCMFVVVSLLLSFQFFYLGGQYTSSYASMERIEWMDPNYFGCVLGMGVVAAIMELRLACSKNLFLKVSFIISIAIIVASMMLNASRGSIVSVAASMGFIVIFSNIKTKYKALAIIAVVGFCVWLYNNGYMDLLQYRVARDAGYNVTNERTDIWSIKYDAFLHEGNILNYLFGFGRDGGLYLGYDRYQGFHNDYIAFLVEYGLLGFLLFSFFMLSPAFVAKNNRSVIIAGTAFLAVSSISLEPFNLGVYANSVFWLYLIVLTQLPEKLKSEA